MCDFDDDFGDDSFMDEGTFEPDYDDHDDLNDDISAEADAEEPCGPDWEDIAFLGAMSEEIAEEKRRLERIRREMFGDDDKKA